MTGAEVLEQIFHDRDNDDSDIELGDDESDTDDEHSVADVQDAVDADDSQLDDDDGSSVLNANNDDDTTAGVKPLHPPHAASMPAGIQSPPPARNDSAIAVVSRPWQVDQLAAKSRKAINFVSPDDSCLQLTPRFLFVHCRPTQN